ncbi:MAG: tetratricopeptide repeat protein [Blastocatellia bacterium]
MVRRIGSLIFSVSFLIVGLAALAAAQSAPCFVPGQYRSRDSVAEQNYQQGEAAYERKNYAVAVRYLTAAEQRGHPRAQSLLGIMYRDGEGVRVNDELAFRLTEKAAGQGHRGSLLFMGLYYSYGPIVQIDMRRANQYLTVAARCGDVYAQTALGMNYEFGLGVLRNRQTALSWLKLAAPNWGQAQWIAEWLRRPATPHFQNADQLDRYINQQVAKYHAGRLPPPKTKTQSDCYHQPRHCDPWQQPDWYKRQQQSK